MEPTTSLQANTDPSDLRRCTTTTPLEIRAIAQPFFYERHGQVLISDFAFT